MFEAGRFSEEVGRVRVVETSCVDLDAYLASPECHARDDVLVAEGEAWWAATRAQEVADLDDGDDGDDRDESVWVAVEAAELSDPYEVAPPALGDPVSPVLLGHLSYRVRAEATSSGLVDGLGAWQRVEGFGVAGLWREIAELHARFTGPAMVRLEACLTAGDDDAAEQAAVDKVDLAQRSLVAEVGAALGWSQSRAAGQVEVALILSTDLVRTLEALAAGVIDVRRAEAIARALAREDGVLCRLVEGEVLPGAGDCNPPELRDRIRKALLRLAPELAAQRAEAARAQRGVSFTAQRDDMVLMEALLPVGEGILVQAALEGAAFDQRTIPGEDRALHQLRADILTATLTGLAATTEAAETTSDAAGGVRGRAARVKRTLRREVVVTVPFATLTGDSDEPGFLSRYGPISAHTARVMAGEVARDGYWRCAVTDTDTAHGTLLGLGRSTFTPAYRAPEYLQRFVNLRDQTCDFPGCRQPAAGADFDHTIPHPTGHTCECGGAKRCRGHHRLKHETAWDVRKSTDPAHPPGTHVWTSPTGREYLTRPAVIGTTTPTTTPARPPEPIPTAEPPPH